MQVYSLYIEVIIYFLHSERSWHVVVVARQRLASTSASFPKYSGICTCTIKADVFINIMMNEKIKLKKTEDRLWTLFWGLETLQTWSENTAKMLNIATSFPKKTHFRRVLFCMGGYGTITRFKKRFFSKRKLYLVRRYGLIMLESLITRTPILYSNIYL